MRVGLGSRSAALEPYLLLTYLVAALDGGDEALGLLHLGVRGGELHRQLALLLVGGERHRLGARLELLLRGG